MEDMKLMNRRVKTAGHGERGNTGRHGATDMNVQRVTLQD